MKTTVATADNQGEDPLNSIAAFVKGAEGYSRNQPYMRTGQAYLNFLFQCGELGMELYNMVTGSPVDPFYQDFLLPAFLGWLAEYTG